MSKQVQSIARIEDGNLIITLPIQPPTPSASRKTLIIATTGGNIPTTLTVDGKVVTIGVNAYIRPS